MSPVQCTVYSGILIITPLVLTHIDFAIPKQSNIPAYFTPYDYIDPLYLTPF